MDTERRDAAAKLGLAQMTYAEVTGISHKEFIIVEDPLTCVCDPFLSSDGRYTNDPESDKSEYSVECFMKSGFMTMPIAHLYERAELFNKLSALEDKRNQLKEEIEELEKRIGEQTQREASTNIVP